MLMVVYDDDEVGLMKKKLMVMNIMKTMGCRACTLNTDPTIPYAGNSNKMIAGLRAHISSRVPPETPPKPKQPIAHTPPNFLDPSPPPPCSPQEVVPAQQGVLPPEADELRAEPEEGGPLGLRGRVPVHMGYVVVVAVPVVVPIVRLGDLVALVGRGSEWVEGKGWSEVFRSPYWGRGWKASHVCRVKV